MVTPQGNIASRRFPVSGSGPNPDRLFLGSEGALGIITEAWVRLHRRPVYRKQVTVRFRDYEKAVEATRRLSQSGLNPANARLVEREEAEYAGSSDGSFDILVLGFESADHAVDARLQRALDICAEHEGRWDDTALKDKEGAADAATASWRNKFLRGPYSAGSMLSPAESCARRWRPPLPGIALPRFIGMSKPKPTAPSKKLPGRQGSVTCRFTHLYPDGPAPYFTWFAYGDKARLPEQYMAIKRIAEEAMVDAGGAVTHHHALGRDHRPWYDKERPELFCTALKAAKAAFDPHQILNPNGPL